VSCAQHDNEVTKWANVGTHSLITEYFSGGKYLYNDETDLQLHRSCDPRESISFCTSI